MVTRPYRSSPTPRRALPALIALTLIILAAGIALRGLVWPKNPFAESDIQLTENYRLAGAHEGDLVIFARSILLTEGSRVEGKASLVGESVTAQGVVEGDVTLAGDTVLVGENAHVTGDLTAFGSVVTLAGRVDGDVHLNAQKVHLLASAQVTGTLTACAAQIEDQRSDATALAPCADAHDYGPFNALIALRSGGGLSAGTGGLFSTELFVLIGAPLLAGISALAVALFPRQMSRLEEAVRLRPRSLAGAGAALFGLLMGLLALMIILLALMPGLGLILMSLCVFGAAVFALLMAAAFATVSLAVGDWTLRRLAPAGATPLVTAVVGGLLVALFLGLVSLLPFGFLLAAALGAVISTAGIGAAVVTRFGTRSLRRSIFVQG